MGNIQQSRLSRYAQPRVKTGPAVAGAACVAVAAIAAILPWYTVSSGAFSGSASGLKFTEGVITLIVGILALGSFIAIAVKMAPESNKVFGLFALLFSIGTALCPIILLIRASGQGATSVSGPGYYAGWGVGFFLAIAAGLGAVTCGCIQLGSGSARVRQIRAFSRERQPVRGRPARPGRRPPMRRR